MLFRRPVAHGVWLAVALSAVVGCSDDDVPAPTPPGPPPWDDDGARLSHCDFEAAPPRDSLPPAEPAQLRAGYGSAVLALPIGTPLGGYGDRLLALGGGNPPDDRAARWATGMTATVAPRTCRCRQSSSRPRCRWTSAIRSAMAVCSPCNERTRSDSTCGSTAVAVRRPEIVRRDAGAAERARGQRQVAQLEIVDAVAARFASDGHVRIARVVEIAAAHLAPRTIGRPVAGHRHGAAAVGNAARLHDRRGGDTWDSTVLVDNFQWIATGGTVTWTPPLCLNEIRSAAEKLIFSDEGFGERSSPSEMTG